jgi:hypothetical protein
VTKSTKQDNLNFIVHVKSQYDYIFDSDFRKEIFDALKYVYWLQNKKNLPVYGVPDRLKDYATSKKDINNGVEVNPKEEYRLRKEDQYEEMSAETLGSQSTNSSSEDEIHQWNNEVKNSVAKNMFSRNDAHKDVGLQDFIIKSVIGRGSFGKVFLV